MLLALEQGIVNLFDGVRFPLEDVVLDKILVKGFNFPSLVLESVKVSAVLPVCVRILGFCRVDNSVFFVANSFLERCYLIGDPFPGFPFLPESSREPGVFLLQIREL